MSGYRRYSMKIKKILSKLLLLCVPFSGIFLAPIKKQLLLLFLPSALFVILITSRLVFHPLGFCLLLFVPVFIFTCSVWCTFYSRNGYHYFIIVRSLFFGAFFTTILLYSIYDRERILGVNVYYVPTKSMVPTIYPGDYIFVDTWYYKKYPPHVGQVVVFFHKPFQTIMVKRVECVTNEWFDVVGDNSGENSKSDWLEKNPVHSLKGKVRVKLDIDNASINQVY